MTGVSPAPRYRFNPLERRGLVLGLTFGQMVTAGAAFVLAIAVGSWIGPTAGTQVGLGVAISGAALALWPWRGERAYSAVALGGSWLARRAYRPRLSAAPTEGRLLGQEPTLAGHRGAMTPVADDHAGSASIAPASVPGASYWALHAKTRTGPGGVSLVEHAAVADGRPAAFVLDRKSGSASAVLAVQGPPFCLLDPAEQAALLEGWRSVLASVGRPGGPVRRLQWVARSSPSSTPADISPRGSASPSVPSGDSSHSDLLTQVAPLVERHDTWIAISVASDAGSSTRRASRQRRLDVLAREVRFLEGQLSCVELRPSAPLGVEALADLLAGRKGGSSPLGVRDGWSETQLDGTWNRTYWISDWPRLEVGPNFLAPLLVSRASRRVSVIMAPVPLDRAVREARSARTADAADSQLRMRAGFLSNARRDREAEGAERREAELADGHCDYRFSGYVTESAETSDGLASACASLEQAAQAARIELRCLYGRQAEAYWWTLPLCRGLR